MVRFVTTIYSHRYENSYLGSQLELERQSDGGLTSVGNRVEAWRRYAAVDVDTLCELAKIDRQTYEDFLVGNLRLSQKEIRAIAKELGTSVNIMTHYLPGHVPDEALGVGEAPQLKTIKVRPAHSPAMTTIKGAKAAQRSRPRKEAAPKAEPYDRDKALEELQKRFGGKVRVDKRL